jgi:hypothetical protein
VSIWLPPVSKTVSCVAYGAIYGIVVVVVVGVFNVKYVFGELQNPLVESCKIIDVVLSGTLTMTPPFDVNWEYVNPAAGKPVLTTVAIVPPTELQYIIYVLLFDVPTVINTLKYLIF